MANTLTNLIPDMLEALDTVSREQVGLVPSVSMDSGAERAAVGQTVRSPVAPAASATDITPGVTPPDDGDQTIGNASVSITKSRRVPIRWNGEQTRAMSNGGVYRPLLQQQVAQAVRTLVNEMEADLAALHAGFSRAAGAAGTTPFATAGDFSDAAAALRILKDNGAPLSDNSLVINTAAGVNLLGKQSRVDIQGNDAFVRQGVILPINGIDIRESAQILTPAAGTGSSATTDNAGYAVGATVITLAAAGTGTIIAGDVITFAGDANQYVVASGDANVTDGGTITLAAPGLRQAIPASATEITVKAAAARNMAFNRSAIVLATRLPALPEDGDSAIDRMELVDPRSGLTLEIAKYAQYRQMQYEVSAAWGVANIKPEHTALLLG